MEASQQLSGYIGAVYLGQCKHLSKKTRSLTGHGSTLQAIHGNSWSQHFTTRRLSIEDLERALLDAASNSTTGSARGRHLGRSKGNL